VRPSAQNVGKASFESEGRNTVPVLAPTLVVGRDYRSALSMPMLLLLKGSILSPKAAAQCTVIETRTRSETW